MDWSALEYIFGAIFAVVFVALLVIGGCMWGAYLANKGKTKGE